MLRAYMLPDGYTVEIDQVGMTEWSKLLTDFDDATIYQTWGYGAVRWGEKKLSHIILKKNGKVKAAAQGYIIKIPISGIGLVYISRGPMWRLKGKEKDIEILKIFIRALICEYIKKRGLSIRINPNEIDDENHIIRGIFMQEGFTCNSNTSPYRSLIINLEPSLDELQMGLKKKWRENLHRAEKNGLSIAEGTSDDLYLKFMTLYQEMHARKKFTQFVDINEFRELQKKLNNDEKMTIMLCNYHDKPISALVWSAMGTTGIPIFSATGDKWLKYRASYLLRWQMLRQLKELGYRYLDQGGINPDRNPGGYHFKAGMGGKDIHHVGQFEVYKNFWHTVLIRSAEKMRKVIQRINLFKNFCA